MATYSELYELRQQADLLNRIAVACMVSAYAISSEDTGTTLHTQRVTWAVDVFNNPSIWAEKMLRLVLIANKDLTITQIQQASDTAIQAQVDSSVNLFASQL